MRKRIFFSLSIIIISVAGLNFSSCYYDNEAELYPNVQCDTVFTYNGRIKAIMDSQCARSGCHTEVEPEADLPLTTYTEVKMAVEDFLILCNIKQTSGCTPMPKNEPPIPACEIAAIEEWQRRGFPEN